MDKKLEGQGEVVQIWFHQTNTLSDRRPTHCPTHHQWICTWVVVPQELLLMKPTFLFKVKQVVKPLKNLPTKQNTSSHNKTKEKEETHISDPQKDNR